jgi:hypothetical protein
MYLMLAGNQFPIEDISMAPSRNSPSRSAAAFPNSALASNTAVTRGHSPSKTGVNALMLFAGYPRQ